MELAGQPWITLKRASARQRACAFEGLRMRRMGAPSFFGTALPLHWAYPQDYFDGVTVYNPVGTCYNLWGINTGGGKCRGKQEPRTILASVSPEKFR